MGVGFLDFLDTINQKVSQPLKQYKKPKTDYDFNDDEKEVCLDEKDFLNDESNSDQDGFSIDEEAEEE